MGQTTISVARRRSATMRRRTATCAASFWPKKARSGSAAMSSLATTVATPRKWPGRDAPSRRSLRPATSTKVVGPVGIELFDRGRKDHVRAFGFGQRAVGLEGARIAGEILVGAELRGVDEDADGDVGARMRARRGSAKRGRHAARPWWAPGRWCRPRRAATLRGTSGEVRRRCGESSIRPLVLSNPRKRRGSRSRRRHRIGSDGSRFRAASGRW